MFTGIFELFNWKLAALIADDTDTNVAIANAIVKDFTRTNIVVSNRYTVAVGESTNNIKIVMSQITAKARSKLNLTTIVASE